jgi:hypothetical protein
MKTLLILFIAFNTSLFAQFNNDLIGGKKITDKADYPSVISFVDNCTAAKVSEFHFLFAAHCVTDYEKAKINEAFQPGKKLFIQSHVLKNNLEVTIEKVFVFNEYYEKMREFLISKKLPPWFAGYFASDVALVKVKEKSLDLMIAEVDFSEVQDTEKLTIMGYGCDRAIGQMEKYTPTLKAQEVRSTNINPLKKSFEHDPELVFDINFLTEGIILNSNSASLCPGDSGGPVFKENKIVGVNSFYTFTINKNISYLNLHTRFNNQKVLEWMKTALKN